MRKNEILEEFYQMLIAQNFITEGGIDYAKEILEKAWGLKSSGDYQSSYFIATSKTLRFY